MLVYEARTPLKKNVELSQGIYVEYALNCLARQPTTPEVDMERTTFAPCHGIDLAKNFIHQNRQLTAASPQRLYLVLIKINLAIVPNSYPKKEKQR